MATASFTTPSSPLTMTALAAFLDAALGELRNAHRGASAPDNPIEGQRWWDTSGGATAEILKRYTVTAGWVSILTMNVTAGTITAIHGIKDEDTMASDSAVLPPSQQSVKAYVDINAGRISNLKPTVNAAVNKLDIFTKSGGAAPDSTNIIRVAIPDGNGHTLRSRAAAYLSGTGQIILADAGNYWSKGSLDGEIKTAWLYAIWDGTGIVWALGGYSGFTRVPTTTTPTDDDYFLLENGSTYTRNAGHFCVSVARIRYHYLTSNSPNYTIQGATTIVNAPQIMWNPKSDYGKSVSLATTITQASDIGQSVVSAVVKQAGAYDISYRHSASSSAGAYCIGDVIIKTGSATYGSATIQSQNRHCNIDDAGNAAGNPDSMTTHKGGVYLNDGDTIHGGSNVYSASGNRSVHGNDMYVGCTMLSFRRID